MSAGIFYVLVSVKPPYLAHENKAEEVDEPEPGETDDDCCDGNDNADHISLVKAAADSVDYPNNVKGGDGKDELCKHGETVDGCDEFFSWEKLLLNHYF